MEQNSKLLTKSEHGITAKGTLGEMIGHNADNKRLVKQILDVTANLDDLANKYPQEAEEAKRFIQKMKRDSRVHKTTSSGNIMKHILLKHLKTRENTSYSPSGLHMSHWKAATEHEQISQVHAFFIWAAFALGTTYERWAVSCHCMLQKSEKRIHKLQIIQLFKGGL